MHEICNYPLEFQAQTDFERDFKIPINGTHHPVYGCVSLIFGAHTMKIFFVLESIYWEIYSNLIFIFKSDKNLSISSEQNVVNTKRVMRSGKLYLIEEVAEGSSSSVTVQKINSSGNPLSYKKWLPGNIESFLIHFLK